MKFSLINITKEKEDLISGYWIQDHIGTIESAKIAAIRTMEVNSNKINIGIVDQLNMSIPILEYFTDLKRLK